jgi:S1-C subfamily serine protease
MHKHRNILAVAWLGLILLAAPGQAQGLREAAAGWDRATPGAGAASPYAGWSEERARAMQGLNRRFCGNLRLLLPGEGFPFPDDAACIARQEALLPRLCDAAGASRARPQSACFAAVNQDMRGGLNRLAALADPQAPRSPAEPLPHLPPPAAAAELRPEEVFSRSEAAIWIVLVDSGIPGRPAAQGSAVAVGPRHLLTNCHVVRVGSGVHLLRGGQRLRAKVSAMDLDGDRCVLQTDDPVLTPIAHLRPAADLRVGERVYAIGAPRGLERSFTEGILSARRSQNGIELVQTTAPVAPGSSGGGVFDARGNLIGISTFGSRRESGLEFAIAPAGFWSVLPLAR